MGRLALTKVIGIAGILTLDALIRHAAFRGSRVIDDIERTANQMLHNTLSVCCVA